jgi:hypothetical protein
MRYLVFWTTEENDDGAQKAPRIISNLLASGPVPLAQALLALKKGTNINFKNNIIDGADIRNMQHGIDVMYPIENGMVLPCRLRLVAA